MSSWSVFPVVQLFVPVALALLGVGLQGTSVLPSPDSGLRLGLQLRTWFYHGPL